MLTDKLIGEVSGGLVTDPDWIKLNRHNNNWKNDVVWSSYHKLGNKQKGTNGEFYVHRLFEAAGYEVHPPAHTDHDKIVNGLKVEIKTSLAVSEGDTIIKDKFIFNHIAVGKDWDRLLFCCVNPDPEWGNMKIRRNDNLPYKKVRLHYMDKSDFVEYMSNTEYKDNVFKHQQSGEKGGNDDFICTNFSALVALPFVREVSNW